ncbi:MAG: AEC family transporter [Lachnospiraceae bacterium]|nr:AEC family transporter [Lachnospiraceae bacterium]
MDSSNVLNVQLMMFIEIAIGFFLKRKRIISEEGKQQITSLVVNLLLPCNIISSFYIPMDGSVIRKGIQVLIISVVIQVFYAIISATCYNWIKDRKKSVLQYGTVCSNAAFLGNPVTESLYGSIGPLYASIYLIPQRIVMWTAGLTYYTVDPNQKKKDAIMKVLTHPTIIAVGIGLILMVTQIRLPNCVERVVNGLGGCCTPIVMLAIGMTMAQADWKTLVSRETIYFSVLRLLLIPLVVFAGCLLAGIDGTAAGICTILAAMPAGSTTVILAARYQVEEEFAGKCVVFSTLLSMVMIPVWSMILNLAFCG